jgi:hypothetical protein
MRRRLWALFVVLALAPLGLFLLYQFILDQQGITWHDYRAVQEGMTQPEVEAVLGPPRHVDARADGSKTVRWIGRKQGMVCVEFTASGAMVRKSFAEDARDYSLSFFPRVRE